MKLKLIDLVIICLVCQKQLYAGVYSFINLTGKSVSVRLEEPGGFDIQLMNCVKGSATLARGRYWVCNAVQIDVACDYIVEKGKGMSFDITPNYSSRKMPRFLLSSNDGRLANFTLTLCPDTINGQKIRISQDFGSEQAERFRGKLAKELIQQINQAYMAVILEPAEGSSQEAKEASSQKSSNAHEEDVNNDSAAEVDEVKYKNTTDEQHVVPCCQIY